MLEQNSRVKRQRLTSKSSKPIPLFLEKTYNMIEDAETDATISWNEAGDGFLVLREHVCAERILPRYFRHSNFSSFVRQLNFYGFKKCFHEVAACEFKHPNFRRGRRDLLCKIKRKTSESNANQKQIIEKLQKDFTDLKERNENLWKFQRKMMYMMASFIRANNTPDTEEGERHPQPQPVQKRRRIHVSPPHSSSLEEAGEEAAWNLCRKIEELADTLPETPQVSVPKEAWWKNPTPARPSLKLPRVGDRQSAGFGAIPNEVFAVMARRSAPSVHHQSPHRQSSSRQSSPNRSSSRQSPSQSSQSPRHQSSQSSRKPPAGMDFFSNEPNLSRFTKSKTREHSSMKNEPATHPFMDSAGSLAETLSSFPQSGFYSEPDCLPGDLPDPDLLFNIPDPDPEELSRSNSSTTSSTSYSQSSSNGKAHISYASTSMQTLQSLQDGPSCVHGFTPLQAELLSHMTSSRAEDERRVPFQ